MNQMNNDIKEARGVKTRDGEVMRSICGRPTLYAKKRRVREHRMGEQVTQEGGGNYEENSVRNEAKRIRDNGRDVLYICVSELGMNY